MRTAHYPATAEIELGHPERPERVKRPFVAGLVRHIPALTIVIVRSLREFSTKTILDLCLFRLLQSRKRGLDSLLVEKKRFYINFCGDIMGGGCMHQ